MPFALLISSLNRGPYRTRAVVPPPPPPPKKPWWRYVLCFFGLHVLREDRRSWDRKCRHCDHIERFDFPAGHGPC